MNRRLLHKYQNGNYTVRLYNDGTKIRENNLDFFSPDFAESIDCTITTKCDGKCQYCYLCCNENGIHADLNQPIFDTVHAGTEMAINGNDLSHPDLENFLIRMKDKGVIVNITINQRHLHQHLDTLKDWQNRQLVWGIGVSLVNSKDKTLYKDIRKLKNVVIHVIDGLFTKDDLENMKNKDIKLLILGFKHVGKGIEYYNTHKEEIDSNIEFLRYHLYDYKQYYNGFGFDSLANEDLHIRELVGEEKWALYHMGEEGEFTFFVDAVNKKFAISSMELANDQYDFLDNLDDMFKFVREKQAEKGAFILQGE